MSNRNLEISAINDRQAVGHTPASWPLVLANLKINAGSSTPIYEQMCRVLRTAIMAGDLPPGTLIPTSREVASVLGVGRNTVVEAYSRLVAEGHLVSNTRRGTRVAENMFGSISQQPVGTDSAALDNASEPPNVEIAYNARRVLEIPLAQGLNGKLFSLHAPDPSLYPRYHLGRFLAKEFRCVLAGDPKHNMGLGSRHFQTALAAHLRRTAGVSCKPEQIIPVSGLRNALDLAIRVLIDPGHNVFVEDPSLDSVRAAFRAAGALVHPVPSDSSGADASRVNGPPPRLIFVSPSASFPLGTQMPEARRIATLGLARKSGAMVFECDTYRELSYTGSRLQAIQGYDRGGQVLYFGSLTEVLGSHIRVGYLVVPPALSETFAEMAERCGHMPDLYVLGGLAKFIEENHYAVHLRSIRSVYAERLRLSIGAARTHFADVAIAEPAGGFHLTLTFRHGIDEVAVQQAAGSQGLAATPLSRFQQVPDGNSGLVLGFAALPERMIEPSIARLAAIVNRSRVHRPVARAS